MANIEAVEATEAIGFTNRLERLNYDVLEVIFKDLATRDLVTLCKDSDFLFDAVAERTIRNHHLDFDYLNQTWPTQRIFETFGVNMSSMKISEHNLQPCQPATAIDELLRLIAAHCLPQRHTSALRRMLLQISVPLPLSPQLLQNAEDFFVNLEKLELQGTDRSTVSDHDALLNTITAKASNLQSLTLRRMQVTGDWFDNIADLRRLNLSSVTLLGAGIYRFLQRRPNMTRFTWNNDDENAPLIDAVCDNCPNLETLLDFHHTVAAEKPATSRYASVYKLTNLQNLCVSSHTVYGYDLDPLFAALCQQNTVKQLVVNQATIGLAEDTTSGFGSDELLSLQMARFFTELHTIGLSNYKSDRRNFYAAFIQDLDSLTRMVIKGESLSHADLMAYFMNNRNIGLFDLSEVRVDDIYYVLENVAKMKRVRRVFEILDFGGVRAPTKIQLNEMQIKEINGREIESELLHIILKKVRPGA